MPKPADRIIASSATRSAARRPRRTVMATRPSNLRRNEWTVRLLDIQPIDQVLAIGFGPGLAVRAAAR